MTESVEIRDRLVDILQLDLVGPRVDGPEYSIYEEEVLPTAPSKWYLTGFLVPFEASIEERSDDTGDDELDQVDRVSPGDDETQPEQASARKAYFPSSMGTSVLVSKETTQLQVNLNWADYTTTGNQEHDLARREDPAGTVWGDWQRSPKEAELEISLPDGPEPLNTPVPESNGLEIAVYVRPIHSSEFLPTGTRAVSVFLVNHRKPEPDNRRDSAFAFQAELCLHALQPFVPRPNIKGMNSGDWDEKVADLQFCDAVEYAVGHNVSVVATTDDKGKCREVRTTWMPVAEVEKVIPRQLDNAQLGMEALSEAETADDIREMLSPMVTEYGTWIEKQNDVCPEQQARKKIAEELMSRARNAQKRIQTGLDALNEPLVLEAFKLTNKVIARAIRQRSIHGKPNANPMDARTPAWYPFQLAFLLMNIAGTVDGTNSDRKIVDLLFFPTGGGKTEAYLGLAAFTMLYRRLKDPSIMSSGLSVLMRYTLRLLTLDQLGRAAALICAMELERQNDVEKLGKWPFEIGLWVGQTATPNRMGKKGDKDRYTARQRTRDFMGDDKHKPSPIPLENCPWCGMKFNRNSFNLQPNQDTPKELRVLCANRGCDFSPRNQNRGLPVLAVDETIYRRLPAFIIATVDKFANLPWVGETAGLFGKVDRYDADGFYGACHPGYGQSLNGNLPPMDLVIQDELHLISGPLGTMVGLYETAIDTLSTVKVGDSHIRPKIVASTATVRRAHKQIQALFGRSDVDVFPAPGPNRRDSFFAQTVSAEQQNTRKYIGVAAQGRNLKVVLLQTCLSLLGGAQKMWLENGGVENENNPADPYMTLLSYFNSLRELGGSRRIIEDEVTSRVAEYGKRRRRVGEKGGMFADRKGLTEPKELTSRVSTNQVAETKHALSQGFHNKGRVDIALATNMISVGLDITRLGLMVVLGQPKTASEYIQATSRVGRDVSRPGLVVTLMNIHRPRDRSHYERFSHWHETFYRAVEATSVTPFSPRAVDRGIAGLTVALARLGHHEMTAPLHAIEIARIRNELDWVVQAISARAEGHDKDINKEETERVRQKIRSRVIDLLETWEHIASHKTALQYQREVGEAPPLLFDPLDPQLEKEPDIASKFKAQRSLRDVEPSVNLWVKTPDDYSRGGSNEA
jgi:hypothetical protein